MSVQFVADLPRRERGVVVGRRDGRLGDFWRRGHGGGLAQRSSFDPRGAAQRVAEHAVLLVASLAWSQRGAPIGQRRICRSVVTTIRPRAPGARLRAQSVLQLSTAAPASIMPKLMPLAQFSDASDAAAEASNVGRPGPPDACRGKRSCKRGLGAQNKHIRTTRSVRAHRPARPRHQEHRK